MKYHDIQNLSMTNGEGLRVVLWVSGCDHHCEGCQNPITWNPDDGLEFTDESMNELIGAVGKKWCDGLTLSGGDPLYVGNRRKIAEICKEIRQNFGKDKTIWLYTGYTMDELQKENDPDVMEILYYIDVLVDGPYIEEMRNIHRYWVGSDNQEIWSKDEHGRWQKNPKQYEKSLNELNLDEQHHKECGCG